VISERRRVSSLLAIATLSLGIALAIRPLPLEQIVAAYVLVVAGIVLASLTRILAAESRHDQLSQFEYLISRRSDEPNRPAELVRVEREITLGSSNAGHLHTRLVPLLRECAVARAGVDFELHPERAQAVLGDELWTLLRPDRPIPFDRNGPGIPLRKLRGVVDELERL
jgi:hypothetical protein